MQVEITSLLIHRGGRDGR